ncbi:hypothetical protein [Pseudoalteromonas sp. SW0106-04]|uniref:hypothetical protein n=1 Tax=Pseudoalteromonas sp. SW0106-04 TaxID=1702169 RepID=UPI0006B42AA5|nr:hypothetical protein [Pseudoalteromonas sp. SW0106-04]
MYLWRTNQLIADFKNNNVSQKETMKYLLTVSLFMLLGSFFMELFPSDELSDKETMYLYIQYLMIALITILGIYFCYEKNQKIDSKNFIERFICFSLPVAIKSFFIITLFFIGMAVFREMIKAGGADLYLNDPKNILKYTIFYELFFYFGIYKAIGKLHKNESTPQLT